MSCSPPMSSVAKAIPTLHFDFEDQMRRTYELEDIILHVLPAMGMEKCDFEKYMGYARVKYLPMRFDIAVRWAIRTSRAT